MSLNFMPPEEDDSSSNYDDEVDNQAIDLNDLKDYKEEV